MIPCELPYKCDRSQIGTRRRISGTDAKYTPNGSLTFITRCRLEGIQKHAVTEVPCTLCLLVILETSLEGKIIDILLLLQGLQFYIHLENHEKTLN